MGRALALARLYYALAEGFRPFVRTFWDGGRRPDAVAFPSISTRLINRIYSEHRFLRFYVSTKTETVAANVLFKYAILNEEWDDLCPDPGYAVCVAVYLIRFQVRGRYSRTWHNIIEKPITVPITKLESAPGSFLIEGIYVEFNKWHEVCGATVKKRSGVTLYVCLSCPEGVDEVINENCKTTFVSKNEIMNEGPSYITPFIFSTIRRAGGREERKNGE